MDMTFTLISSTMMKYNSVQKELLMMFEGFCIFGFWEFYKNFFCILMEVNKTMYGNNEDDPKSFLAICIQNHIYVMSHLQLCGISLRQMKTKVSINHQWIDFCLLYQCAPLCMEQYAWIHAISSMMHAGWFFYPSNCQSHILKRLTWLDRTTCLERAICLIYGVRITSDYGSSLVTGSRLVFSQCYVSDHFLVLFYAPLASLISFSIPTLAASAGTIPSRTGYI